MLVHFLHQFNTIPFNLIKGLLCLSLWYGQILLRWVIKSFSNIIDKYVTIRKYTLKLLISSSSRIKWGKHEPFYWFWFLWSQETCKMVILTKLLQQENTQTFLVSFYGYTPWSVHQNFAPSNRSYNSPLFLSRVNIVWSPVFIWYKGNSDIE